MRQILLPIAVLPFISAISSAQVITETFGTGANAFSIDFVQIGNPGNVADSGTYYGTSTPYTNGSVAYTYNIGKYEISRMMIDRANQEVNLGITMMDMTNYGGNGVNRPAEGISWYEAAKFVNYLNSSTGSTVAYKFDGSGTFKLWSSGDAGYNSTNPFRNSLARFFLPSSEEWYKAAYGSPNGNWYNYPTGSDIAPTAVATGTALNTAVYNQSTAIGPADITDAGGLSAWGTMAQGGNAFEWTDTAYDGVNDTAGENMQMRGGNWNISSLYFEASKSALSRDPAMDSNIGFRVAMVPEPSALSLLAVGLGGLAMIRRRRS